jgi:hypothetical protein
MMVLRKAEALARVALHGPAMGGEADHLLTELSDSFVSRCVLVHVFGLANIQEYSERFQRFIYFQAGDGRLAINS